MREMTPRHHPRPQTLALYHAGELNPGAALGVSAHVDACPHCQAAIAEGKRKATGSLKAAPALSDGSISQIVARVPGARLGRWRWAGFGLRLAHVEGAAGLGERVYVIEGRPGARLAAHGHAGAEYVSVLKGQVSEDGEAFDAGDFSEHEASDCAHRLRVIGQETCICLVATEAPLRLSGAARLLQPWLGV